MTVDEDREQQRPSPDALLAEVTRAARARLRLFLGAAPGVGKTFEMLGAARRKRADGADLVVGIVETHGRADTQALLEGLEIVPRLQCPYKGRLLEEMDLDAILARRPAIVLVDELAHSNAPGSRHDKRYQDVLELLDAGIEVWSTLNVQHIESLNDVVSQITRIRVRETIPDSVIDTADVELVDITPAELIERLHEGKVYIPEQAQRALKHYFSAGNLTALRELALRRTAQRVDEQMLGYMRAHAISGPWAAGERILVCIDEREGAAQLVRHAKRLADLLRAPWAAVHVETPRTAALGERERDRIADTLRLGERLGGESLTLPGRRIADVLLAYARESNITQIVIGKAARSRLFELTHGSVVDELVRRAGNITVQVIAGAKETMPAKTVSTSTAVERPRALPYIVSSGFVAVAGGAAFLIDRSIAIPNISLVFLAAVLLSAILFGLLPSIFTSVVAVLAYNYLLTEPRFTFTVAHPENILALIVFLVTAVAMSGIASRLRLQTVIAQGSARRTAELYAFSRKLAGTANLYDVLWAAAHQVATMLKADVVILLPEDSELKVQAGYPPEDQLDGADLAAARWTWDHNKPAGRGAETLPGAARLFLPMRTSRGSLGVVGLRRHRNGQLLTPDERRLLDALLDQTALAIERTQFALDIEEARLLTETERLRAALLASVSHDLRTPLATILGTFSALRLHGALYDDETRDEMLASGQEEAERLNRFVANLLDMTRLDTGAIELRRDWVDIADVIDTAAQRQRRALSRHRLTIDLAPDLPLLRADGVLLEQAIANLLDNAAQHTPPQSTVTMRAVCQEDGLSIDVLDEGPGIPDAAIEQIFDRFFRLNGADRERAGTGLGLAVAKGFVEAVGGTIAVANRSERSGAVFSIHFPAELLGTSVGRTAPRP